MTAATMLNVLMAANAAFDLGARLYLAVKDLPAEGTPEEQAKLAEVKARLAARAEQVRDLPILDVP